MSGPFSRVYCVPDSANKDSERLRFRLGTFVAGFQSHHEIAQRIEIECGVSVPWMGSGRDWRKFYKNAELRDVLDSVTHVFNILFEKTRDGYSGWPRPREWQSFVARVFAEEHTTYVVDDRCQVRFAVDEQYATSRKATLAGLQADKWGACRAEFERAFAAMDGETQDTNGAVRAIAAAVESCAKVVAANGMARLGPVEVQRFLRPKIEAAYQGDEVATNAAALMLKALAEWVNASHQYRHGQDADDEVHAPAGLTVQFLTSGAGFIRWMIAIDAQTVP
ncbi:hypothetical protein [Lysobacter terrae]